MKKLISAVAIAIFSSGIAYAQMPAKADVNAMANGAVDAAKTSATTTAKTAATNTANSVTSTAAANVDAKTSSIGSLPANAGVSPASVPAPAQKTVVNDKPVKVNSHKKHTRKHHKQSTAVTAKKTA
jgi:hypothetical protein